MFSKGHVTVMLCLFLQYDPQTLKFSIWFSTHFEIFDMLFNTVFNMVHTIGEFLCLKCVENILKKHLKISECSEICNAF